MNGYEYYIGTHFMRYDLARGVLQVFFTQSGWQDAQSQWHKDVNRRPWRSRWVSGEVMNRALAENAEARQRSSDGRGGFTMQASA